MCLALGIRAYYKDPTAKLNRIFLSLCVSVSWCLFIEFFEYVAENAEFAVVWVPFFLPWVILAILVHFIFTFMRREEGVTAKLLIIGIYVPAIIFTIFDMIPGITQEGVTKFWWGWGINYVDFTLNIVRVVWGAIVAGICIILLYRLAKKSEEDNLRKQANLILGILFLQFTGGIITGFILVLFSIQPPDINYSWYLGICLVMGYAMAKYKLFSPSPAIELKGIISTISEAFLLVTYEGKIIDGNDVTYALLDYRPEQLKGMRIQDLFAGLVLSDSEVDTERIRVLAPARRNSSLEVNIWSRNGDAIPVSVSKSRLINNEGFTQGYIYLLSNLTELKQAQQVSLKASGASWSASLTP